MNTESVKKFEDNKWWAMLFGAAVYVGAVLLFAAFYEKMMAEHFTGFLGTVARVGAFFVAGNALALPLALHFWAVGGWHKGLAIGFYVADLVVMALNVIAAAYTGDSIDWIVSWRAISPASIVLVLVTWGVLYMADPGQKALVKLQESITNAQVAIVDAVVEHVKSDEGIDSIIGPLAEKMAARVMNERKLIGAKQSLRNVPIEEEDTGDVKDALVAVLEKAGYNGTSEKVAASLLAGVNPTHASTKKK